MALWLKTAKCSIHFGKLIGSLVCWFVFFFWGIQALHKYLSYPIASSISFTNGDDGQGNLNFPALTICLTNYYEYLNRLLIHDLNYCEEGEILSYNHALIKCLVLKPGKSSITSTTTEGGLFGNLFGNGNDDTYELFSTLEEFMDVTKIEISDILEEFEIGNLIKITNNLDESYRKEYLKELWIPTFHQTLGPCFTFDPEKQNATMLSSGVDISGNYEPPTIRMEFLVRYTQVF